jgi:glycosyltransferase involved in cell wall biosynthesis
MLLTYEYDVAPKRIAMFSWESLHSIQVGGLAAHVSELSEALARMGHDVHIFTRMDRGQCRYDYIKGVHYHRCPVGPHPDFLTYVDKMCESFAARLREAEAFYGRPFDIIHGHDWLSAKALAQVKKTLGRPVVLTMHSTEFGRCGNELCNGMSRRIRDVEWEGTYEACRVICVSQALKEEVKSLYSVPDDKMTAIYNGVEMSKFDVSVDPDSVRAKYGVGASVPLVLFVGRLAWQKGPDLLLNTIPGVLGQFPDAKFVFAGDGDMRAGLERTAAGAGLFGAVRFAGYRTGLDLVQLFKAADTVCVPSRNEPFGIVVLEAWSSAKPVVVTRSGGPSEFVRDGENGFVVSADKESIGWGVGMALSDTERSLEMGRNGRFEVESHFTWDVIACQTDQVYQAL